MYALSHDRYGSAASVLRIVETPNPSPGPGEARVRVQAAGLNPADWHAVWGEPLVARFSLGLRAPRDRVPGCDVAGVVVELGHDASPTLRVGDAVFGCAFGAGLGAFADEISLPTERLVRRPDALGPAEAASVPLAALTALQAVRDHGRAGAGDRVLVIGAGGGVGSFAVPLAAQVGARVDAVCRSRDEARVLGLGAERVFARDRGVNEAPSPGRYDVVLQLGGADSPGRMRSLLRGKGTLVQVGGDGGGRVFGATRRILAGAARAAIRRERTRTMTVHPNRRDLEAIADRLADGRLLVPPFRQIGLAEVPARIDAMRSGAAEGRAVARLSAD